MAGSRPEGLGQREAVSWGRKGAGEKSNSAGERANSAGDWGEQRR